MDCGCNRTHIFIYKIVQKKKVRIGCPKVQEIQPFLKEARSKANITIREIERIFGNSAAHHWFEKIEYASLPDVDQWIKLKEILGFDDTYDEIMTSHKLMTDYEIMVEHRERHKNKGNGFGIEERRLDEKAIALTTWAERTQIVITEKIVRRLTPKECERLQTLPDNYTKFVLEKERYRMLGNGWTVDAVAHIFSYLEK